MAYIKTIFNKIINFYNNNSYYTYFTFFGQHKKNPMTINLTKLELKNLQTIVLFTLEENPISKPKNSSLDVISN